MFKFLIDTCVWLDLAKRTELRPVLGVVEQMVRHKQLALVVPRLVLEEFRRNRERIAKESAKSLSTHFRAVREAVGRAGGSKRRQRALLKRLEDVDHKIPIIGGEAASVLARIDKLLAAGPLVEVSDAAKLRAAQRAVDKRAPFHSDKNAMADALLMEAYDEAVRDRAAAGTRFAFVTHNKADFSVQNGDHRLPHPDFAGSFSRVKSLYFISLTEALRRVDPSMVAEFMFEYSFSEEPRGRAEILQAEDVLWHQIWYNRHLLHMHRVKTGRVKIVDDDDEAGAGRYAPDTITRGTLKVARAAGRRVWKKYRKKGLGPWSDFEWGMLNGKLSALRWVLGSEWDFLDT